MEDEVPKIITARKDDASPSRPLFHQQAGDELGGDHLGGAGEEGLGEVLGGLGGYGSGFFEEVLSDADGLLTIS